MTVRHLRQRLFDVPEEDQDKDLTVATLLDALRPMLASDRLDPTLRTSRLLAYYRAVFSGEVEDNETLLLHALADLREYAESTAFPPMDFARLVAESKTLTQD